VSRLHRPSMEPAWRLRINHVEMRLRVGLGATITPLDPNWVTSSRLSKTNSTNSSIPNNRCLPICLPLSEHPTTRLLRSCAVPFAYMSSVLKRRCRRTSSVTWCGLAMCYEGVDLGRMFFQSLLTQARDAAGLSAHPY
jgi:hypothetical protein